jgi:hypothetical protein
MVNPKILCRQHLLGEHKELHMIAGCMKRNKNIDGFVKNGLIDTSKVMSRHVEIVAEMQARGYNHHSPIEHQLPDKYLHRGSVSVEKSKADLISRCSNCKFH